MGQPPKSALHRDEGGEIRLITVNRIPVALVPYVIVFLLVLWGITGFHWQLFAIASLLGGVLLLHIWSARKRTDKLLIEAGQQASRVGRAQQWSRHLPAKSGWYWYRSTWNGQQDGPELICVDLSTANSGEPEFVTAGAINLFLEDLTRMNTEFWMEPVTPPPMR